MPTVQQNPATEANVSWRSQPAGACVSNEAGQEIANGLVVQMPESAPAAPISLSPDANNLAQLDAANALLVPGVLVYSGSLSLAPGDTSAAIFSGWSGAIDGTIAFMELNLLIDPTETGVETGVSSGVFVWPQIFVTDREVTQIKVKVKNNTKTVTITLRLAQLPNPPVQS